MHPSNKIELKNLGSVVYHHKPTPTKIEKFDRIAKACEELMKVILENAPDCADRTTALRAARESRMWANSAVALDNAKYSYATFIEDASGEMVEDMAFKTRGEAARRVEELQKDGIAADLCELGPLCDAEGNPLPDA